MFRLLNAFSEFVTEGFSFKNEDMEIFLVFKGMSKWFETAVTKMLYIDLIISSQVN